MVQCPVSGLLDTAEPHPSVPLPTACLPVAAGLETGTARRALTHLPVLLNSGVFPVCWGAEAFTYFEMGEKTKLPAKPLGCSQRQAFPMAARLHGVLNSQICDSSRTQFCFTFISHPGLTTRLWKTVRVKQETFHSCYFSLSCPHFHKPVQKCIDAFSWKAGKFDI